VRGGEKRLLERGGEREHFEKESWYLRLCASYLKGSSGNEEPPGDGRVLKKKGHLSRLRVPGAGKSPGGKKKGSC